MKFAAILGLLLVSGCHAQFEITMMLKNVTFLVGDDAVIPCTYEAPETDIIPTIKWSTLDKDGQQTAVYSFKKGGNSFPYSNAYRIFQIGDNGELLIPGVTIDDDKMIAGLGCEVEIIGDTKMSKEGRLDFSVVSLPDVELTITSHATEFESGGKAKDIATCESGYAYPTPEIFFYRENKALNEDMAGTFVDDFTTNRLVTTDGDMSKVQDTLNRVLTKLDDQVRFYCVVISGGGSPETTLVQNKSIDPFRVKYPTDAVRVVAENDEAFVGEEFVLTCEANGYPSPNIDFEGGTGSTIRMELTKDDNGREFTCSARNNQDMEPIEDVYTVTVLYADEPMIEGNTVVNYGEALSLTCSGNSRPAAISTVWKKDGNVVSSEALLSIDEARFEHAGVYTCEMENQYAKLSKTVDSSPVTVSGLLLEKPENEDVEGEPKTTVTITCTATSSPEPTFEWKRMSDDKIVEGEVTMEGDNKYMSTITVGPLDAALSKAEYMCTVTNGESETVSKKYTLPDIQPEVASPTAGIIIGILVAILVVAIIIAVLYNKGIICKKGEEKGDEDAEDIQPIKINKEEAEPVTGRPDDVEAGRTEANAEAAEDTQLMNGSGDQ